ncbi:MULTISPECIES: catechol 1,2-dioxygenase [Nocardiaceae]|uniref:DODA-type extradiol aromatic ring-opening family dioxygenase n=1 Tax=Nocardiaceae TaxID=85025 RepID=UPI000AC75367|nr:MULTISPECIES: catechol 1,2-dioxygenase [Rhodococcus]
MDVDLARHLANDMVEGGAFDPAFSARLQIDHGQSQAIQNLLDGIYVPIVPIVVNVFAPPLPTFARCREFAAALRESLERESSSKRVVVIESGGLSHRLPWPDWREPHGDDEDFMVQARLDGRDNWSQYDIRRREIIRAAQSSITPSFDDYVLRLFEKGNADEMADYSTDYVEKEAGNGAQELRTWLMMSTLLRDVAGERVAYEAIPEWLTGMGITILDPTTQKQEIS